MFRLFYLTLVMEYTELFKELSKNKIRYLICGGLAVNIYGVPRMTADIDLLLDFTQENISKFETIINSFNYKSLLPVPLKTFIDLDERLKAKKQNNLIAFSYYNVVANSMNVDILMDVPLKFDHMWESKEVRKTEGVEVNIVSLNDLITLKEYSNRVQDRQDILMLRKFKK